MKPPLHIPPVKLSATRTPRYSPPAPLRWLRPLLLGLLSLVVLALSWTWWGDNAQDQLPKAQRQLRSAVQDQFKQWFPQPVAPPTYDWYGLELRIRATASKLPRLVVIHGLDEPGSIWHDLFPFLDAAGFEVWEFRYPHDQSIERTAQDLAERWREFPTNRPAILIGHDVGGLVIRDFVTRWRHPVNSPARVDGAAVRGAILVGTPNQGSEWTRLRVWLELRDQFLTKEDQRFALYAALRDGCDTPAIDLQPNSGSLTALNTLPWSNMVSIQLLGGVLSGPTPSMSDSIAALTKASSAELQALLMAWWSNLGVNLGDGVVTLDALKLPNAPAPLQVAGSHRGMLTRLLPTDPEPPAIALILQTLTAWNTAPAAIKPPLQ
ncbi:esterase/lipase family protein [Chromatium okenii]|uniref:esterase/lipase family protein n=2 Tax=Chromatium okenii TaxID=61644 RepID=UPI001F5C0816|nr:alpha/beta hydrolase [Chromatium okenii]